MAARSAPAASTRATASSSDVCYGYPTQEQLPLERRSDGGRRQSAPETGLNSRAIRTISPASTHIPDSTTITENVSG